MKELKMCVRMNKNVLINNLIKREKTPNSDTIDAFREFDVIKKHPENYKRYDSFSEALKDLCMDTPIK